MQLVNVAAVALNQTPLDWSGNASNIRNTITAAGEQGARIVCLPELCITGYGCEDAFLSADVQRRAERVLRELISSTEGLIVSVRLPVMHAGALYNCIAIIADQRLLGFVAKSHLLATESITNRAGSRRGRMVRRAKSRSTASRTRLETSSSTLPVCESALRFAKMPGRQTGLVPSWLWRRLTLF